MSKYDIVLLMPSQIPDCCGSCKHIKLVSNMGYCFHTCSIPYKIEEVLIRRGEVNIFGLCDSFERKINEPS
jgi:hypothetical protein